MAQNKEESRQAAAHQNYSPLSAIIKAGNELESVLEHLQKDEFTSDDIRQMSSSFNDVIKAVNKINRILVIKIKE